MLSCNGLNGDDQKVRYSMAIVHVSDLYGHDIGSICDTRIVIDQLHPATILKRIDHQLVSRTCVTSDAQI